MRPLPTHTLNPRVKLVWRITSFIYILFIYLIAVSSVLPLYFTNSQDSLFPTLVIVFSGIALVATLIFSVVVPQVRFMFWHYEVGTHELDIARGIIWRKRFIIPFVRVQNTDTRQGPLMRVFGLASVAVSTAAGTHEIPGLSFEEADTLRDLIAEQARLAQEDV